MKKLISLLLVLALSLTVLSSMAFAAVSECDEADAVVKVTVEGSEDVYYMDGLDNTVVNWACKSLTTGRRTITLLKDVELDPDNGGAMTSAYFMVPGSTGSWGNKHYGKLTFDLNGHTLSYTGVGNLFYHLRYPFEVKNGTIIFHNTNEGYARYVVSSGEMAGKTANYNGGTELQPWAPHIVFDNVEVFNLTETADANIFRSNLYNVVYDVTNCKFHCGTGGVMNFGMTTQANETDKYVGAYAPILNMTNCVAYTDGDAMVYNSASSPEGAVVNVKDSAFVTLGNVIDDGSTAKIVSETDVKEVPNYAVAIGGETYTAVGYVYGNAPASAAAEKAMNFSDVKESDWFYSFVKELYNKGVVAGTTATTFAPNANLTYGAALKLLVVGLTGKDAGNAASGHWATNYLNAAVTAGWTTVGADKLDTPITREAFCEIAAKAAGLTEQAENKFTDTQNPAVLALVKAGVINGMSETTFAPASILTRAQISKIISLLLKL